MIRLIRILFIVIFLTSCVHNLRFRSNPDGAEVFAISPKTGDRKPIGKTPIEVSVDKLSEFMVVPPSSREYLILEFVAPEYDNKRLLVPVGTLGAFNTHVDVKLSPAKKGDDKAKLVVQHLLNTQDFINSGDLNRANLEVEKIVQLDKENPWAYVMRGHIFLLKKDYKGALALYEKSVELDPTNESVLKRITHIRKYLKGVVNETE